MMGYKFRNLPCNIVPDNDLWCLCGTIKYRGGIIGGVLEWCYDEKDAKQLKKQIEESGHPSSGVKVEKWKTA